MTSPLTPWHAANLARITRLLDPLRRLPSGLIYDQKTAANHLAVFKTGRQVELYFMDPRAEGSRSISGVMSRIDLDAPLVLLGTYAQAMMLSLVWKKSPAKVYLLGFGGGRIAMVFHHYFPEVVVEGTDVDRDVLDLSARFFGMEADARMRIFREDGRAYLERQEECASYDILLVDCFTGVGTHPLRLSTLEFYAECKRHLADGGVVATNLIEGDPFFDEKVATLAASFDVVYDFASEGAHVFFGSDSRRSPEEILTAARELAGRRRFEFPLEEHAKVLRRVDAGAAGPLSDLSP